MKYKKTLVALLVLGAICSGYNRFSSNDIQTATKELGNIIREESGFSAYALEKEHPATHTTNRDAATLFRKPLARQPIIHPKRIVKIAAPEGQVSKPLPIERKHITLLDEPTPIATPMVTKSSEKPIKVSAPKSTMTYVSSDEIIQSDKNGGERTNSSRRSFEKKDLEALTLTHSIIANPVENKEVIIYSNPVDIIIEGDITHTFDSAPIDVTTNEEEEIILQHEQNLFSFTSDTYPVEEYYSNDSSIPSIVEENSGFVTIEENSDFLEFGYESPIIESGSVYLPFATQVEDSLDPEETTFIENSFIGFEYDSHASENSFLESDSTWVTEEEKEISEEELFSDIDELLNMPIHRFEISEDIPENELFSDINELLNMPIHKFEISEDIPEDELEADIRDLLSMESISFELETN